MVDYAIELLTTEIKELKDTIEFVENPESVRYYKDDDKEDLERWNRQIKDLERALNILKNE